MADTDPAPTSQPLPELHTLVVGREAMACRFEVVFNAGEVPDATELGLAALDLVEINPILDAQNQTAVLGVELALSAFGQRII